MRYFLDMLLVAIPFLAVWAIGISGVKTCPEHSRCKTNVCSDGGLCSECADGYYGIRCNFACPTKCVNKQCGRYTVSCILGCEKGWYGEKCLQPCTACQNGCGRESGECVADDRSPDDCKNSNKNVVCNNVCNGSCDNMERKECEECRDMTNNRSCGFDQRNSSLCLSGCMGVACDVHCRHRCVECDRYTGQCTVCEEGWHGEMCDLMCPASCEGTGCGVNENCTSPYPDGGSVTVSVGPEEDIFTMSPTHDETLEVKYTLILECCLLAAFILMGIVTIKCCVFSSGKRKSQSPTANSQEVSPEVRRERPASASHMENGPSHEANYISCVFSSGERKSQSPTANSQEVSPEVRRERPVSASHMENGPSHEAYLHPVHDVHVDVWMDNVHYHLANRQRFPGTRPGPSHYETLDLARNGDPGHVYDNMSCV